MLPVMALSDGVNCGLSNAISSGDSSRFDASRFQGSDFSDRLFCQDGTIMSFAPAVPAFTAAILIVVLLRAKKQVVIPYAGRIIAMMKNIFSCRNQSVLQFPHHTRGRLRSMVYTKQAISARSSTARPWPRVLSTFFQNRNVTSPRHAREQNRLRLCCYEG